MPRIEKVSEEQATGEVKELFAAIKKKFGKVPNVFQFMARSPQLLKGFLTLGEIASKSSLSPKLQEKIAVAVADSNHCSYCQAAHTAGLKSFGVPLEEIEKARAGNDADKKTDAILKFSKLLAEKRGQVSDEEINALKKAGVSDQEIGEIILAVTVNILTNTFNETVKTPVDF